MKIFVTYILYSEKHNKYYVGHTGNIDRRLEEHNFLSDNSYTSKYRPWRLLISLEVDTRSRAMKIEKYLKKKPRAYFFRLIDDIELQKYILKRFI